jgi:protein O-GlcNAc transferase
MSVLTPFEQAVKHHQAGQLQQARLGYLAVLNSEPGHPEANHKMGVLLVQENQSASSLPYLMAALEADPACSQYWLSYADALYQSGQTDAAKEVLALAKQQGLQGAEVDALDARLNFNASVAHKSSFMPAAREINALVEQFGRGDFAGAATCAQSMTERYPRHELGWRVLGMARQQMGQNAEALIPMQNAAALSQNDAQAHSNLGIILSALGRHDEACASYRQSLRINPGYVHAHANLGNALRALGRYDEACASYRQALIIKPDLIDVYNNLGLTLHDQGRLKEACDSYRRALNLNSNCAEVHNNLGNTLNQLGRLEEACEHYRQALKLKPDFAQAQNNLGLSLHALRLLPDAESCFREALSISPDYAEAHCNLGLTLHDQGRLFDAQQSLERALKLNPDYADAHCNLGNALLGLGRLDDALVSYRQALRIRPGFAMAHSNLIFNMDLMPGFDTAALQSERKKWAVLHADHLRQHTAYNNSPDPNRRLRIGYVSADFRIHSAAYAFGAMLTQFDSGNFDIFAYSNSIVEDELTRTFQASVTDWRNIARLSDDAAADLIRADRIDILVDLSGHSAGNRLLVFARKPAPIQITAWGYAAATGMSAMDVFFADPVYVPSDEKGLYAEKIGYLPCVLGFYFPHAAPPVNALPALSGRGVTFGSFNRMVKNSEQAYDAWIRILQAIPDSRMVFKTPALDDADTRARMLGNFTCAGIDPARIVLLGKTGRDEHLAAFNQIDIALDPFPHGGGVSALEGLMMGVPVITLHWPTLAGRLSASIVTSMGLCDWVVQTQEQYVELAVEKARDLQSLSTLRQQLRGIFTSSILGDQAAYVQVVEREYRKLWQDWCAV